MSVSLLLLFVFSLFHTLFSFSSRPVNLWSFLDRHHAVWTIRSLPFVGFWFSMFCWPCRKLRHS